MMLIFGIPANLLSLGALDFGIIIDGGVIIVEFVALRVFQKFHQLKGTTNIERRKQIDSITFDGASKMMNSAIFGQLVIFIVFIPILSLSGVEGKMFIPMALTFCFALLGAMILCFTWIPVAASLFLKPKNIKPNNIGNRIINLITKSYDPVITWALKRRKVVIGLSMLFLGFGIYIYSKSGGEFVPTLDEGSFVIQPVLKTGKSLEKTIERTTDIEKILLDKFPEVKQVITRIGAAEVPTDPMSMEETDIIVLLKPKDEWESADSKEDLADKMKAALSVFPNMPIEFTQPIEMRFNELITGSRSDIAIKIYGEDLDILAQKGDEIKKIAKTVPGAADISVDKITGLPQMKVDLQRDELSRYGLTVQEVNDVIATGFAGSSAGVVFEGEERYDLVVRLKKEERQSIDDLSAMVIDTPTGNKITLSDVADVRFAKSPAMIPREDTKRRITVGVNVRQSDLETVVNKIRNKVEQNVDLPAGYTIDYGGQFENLQKAKSRLKIAVPFALILIFILLFFALRSVKDTILIFLSIPFAAVGGILLLWLRDMPFSISGGVGFIALFGIAVLNGIIVIDYINTYKAKGEAITPELMKKVTKERIRAIVLTASSTALGFLPMAISTGSGAEVQRPLATVVIGGLITSTLLTLVVLPVVYLSVSKAKKVKISKTSSVLLFFIIASILPALNYAQQTELDSLKSIMLENNYDILSSKLSEEKANAAKGEAFDFQRTQVFIGKDENEIPQGFDQDLNQYGISQTFDFPTVYTSKLKQKKAQRKLAASFSQLTEIQKIRKLELLYDKYSITKHKLAYLKKLSQLYEQSSSKISKKYTVGDTTKLAKMRISAAFSRIQYQIEQQQSQFQELEIAISQLVHPEEAISIEGRKPELLEIDDISMDDNTEIDVFKKKLTKARQTESVLKSQYLPGFYGSYAITTRNDIDQNLKVFQIGLKIPLLFFGQRSRVKQQQVQIEQDKLQLKAAQTSLQNKRETLMNRYMNHQNSRDLFQKERLPLSDELAKTARKNRKLGAIDFFTYTKTLKESLNIKIEYLNFLVRYNTTVIQYNNLLIQ
jgi:cobalt-zinc-cadmium resistance protein CzcA